MSNQKPSKTNWKEERRFHALKLKQSGWKQSEIAIALKVSKGTVSQWFHKARAQGEQSLQLLSPPGRPPELGESQKKMIPDLLSQGAEAYGFRGDVWTCRRVKKVIEWEFGVSYHRSHVARLLKELGWTPQQPMERAAQRDETEIHRWRTRTWFEIQNQAVLERRLLVFVDESGFYLLPAILRT